jgi:hypothetical protein
MARNGGVRQRLGEKWRGLFTRPDYAKMSYAEFHGQERRRLIRYCVLFGAGLIAAAYFGTKSRHERLACIAAGGTEMRDAQGNHPYCIPAPDTTAVRAATTPPSVLQTPTPPSVP